jgi:uncharacterized membrane protein (Fun14 family)
MGKVQEGVVDKIKSAISGVPPWLSDATFYGFFGCIAGFITRTVGYYLFIALLLLAFLLWGMSSADLITINVLKMKMLFGIEKISSIDELVRLLITWVQTHVAASIGMALGFMIGWKMGS